MKTTKTQLANTFALAAAALWVICSAFVAAFPGFSLTVAQWWLHGMNIGALGTFRLGWDNFFWGGVTLVISLWVVGYVAGWSAEVVKPRKGD